MTKKQTIIVNTLAIVVILVGGIWLLRSASSDNQPVQSTTAVDNSIESGVLQAVESSYDFGTVSMAAGKVSRTFTITNNGAGPVILTKLYTSCMCTTATLNISSSRRGPFGMPGHGFLPSLNERLGSGEQAAIEVVFDPAAHGPAGIGRIERVVYLESRNAASVELSIAATVTP